MTKFVSVNSECLDDHYDIEDLAAEQARDPKLVAAFGCLVQCFKDRTHIHIPLVPSTQIRIRQQPSFRFVSISGDHYVVVSSFSILLLQLHQPTTLRLTAGCSAIELLRSGSALRCALASTKSYQRRQRIGNPRAGSSRGSGVSFTIGVRSLCVEVPVC